jgi:PAS domain S-box-containing protein
VKGDVHQTPANAIILRTAEAVGEAFFREAAEALTDTFGIRWVLIGRYDDKSRDSARTILFWDNAVTENVEFRVRESVWEALLETGECIRADALVDAFPGDSQLRQMGAESCAGASLRSSDGKVIGFLTVLDDKAMEDAGEIAKTLTRLAPRVGAELERLEQRDLNERLGAIVEDSRSEVYIFSGDSFLFETVNRGARENLGYSMEELSAMAPWDIKPRYSEDEFRRFVGPLLSGERESLSSRTIHRRKDGSDYDVDVQLQFFPGADNVFFASISDITAEAEAQRHEAVLLNEVNHRSKNMLTVVQAIASQTRAGDPDTFSERFSRRLAALAANQDMLVRNSWRRIPMGDLVISQLAFVRHLVGKRIHVSGPAAPLTARAAEIFGMALHELTTNALKYGALSNETGTVAIGWAIDEANGGVFRLSWEEEGGPEIDDPSETGFGAAVIIEQPEYALDAEIETRFEREGLRYTLSAPIARILDAAA